MDDQINPVRPELYRDPEAALGGADTVQKTSYVGDARGAEPDDPRDGKGLYGPAVPPGQGGTILAWATALLTLVAAIAYLVGVF